MSREVWLGTSWKMNKVMVEAEAYARELKQFLAGYSSSAHLFVIPPFTAIQLVARVLRNTAVLVGAQNMHWEESGPQTGEISPLMLKDCGASLVEIGHSERRLYFGETDFTVNKKVHAALAHNLIPLICIGEPEQEKQFRVQREYVRRQIKIALADVAPEQLPRIIVAYEPVWAVGTHGKPAQPAYANGMHETIRSAIAELATDEVAQLIPVLYGGSVAQGNAASFMAQAEIDGLFVGRAAWDIAAFIELIHLVDKAM
ncbi:triose-phosphate isomerase [Ktedonosporobacter rubrisoli]|uniref:Triosephosphate isomerase n=1 Tax=Ktedonosporobacter rubrisoli TaxID=2509675 RepID=A0A4P6JSX0_KTERU|nr:triose-phosphate isomerase [Ktedonosporobacter rubrisoli]QBD78659.1 triose-phosphate isomerase [Ktedonosporobacter rubrisoli]